MEALENAENFSNTDLKKNLLKMLAESQNDDEQGPIVAQETRINHLNEIIENLEKECSKLKEELQKKQEQLNDAWKKVNEKNKEIVDLKNSRGMDPNIQKYKQQISELQANLEKEKKRADEALELAEKLITKIKTKK